MRRRPDVPGIERRIAEALAAIAPMIRLHAAGIELVEFHSSTGVALLRFEGDCPDCDMSAAMLRQGIEAHLRTRVPEIREVRAI